MSFDILQHVTKKILAYNENGHSKFIWHGGEPLMVNERFYLIAKALQQYYAQEKGKIKNSIQSNGTLFNQENVELLKMLGFSVAVSYDGLDAIQDTYRYSKRGAPVSETVNRNLASFGERLGCVVVATDEVCDHIVDVYSELKNKFRSFRINPVIPTPKARKHGVAVDVEKFTRAMLNLFDIWLQDLPTVRIQNFATVILNLIEQQPRGCSFMRSCQEHIIGIDYKGDIYPCNRFDNTVSEYCFGNINEIKNLRELEHNPRQIEFMQRYEHLKECQACQCYKMCYGGCPFNALSATGSIFAKDPFCYAYKTLYTNIARTLDQLPATDLKMVIKKITPKKQHLMPESRVEEIIDTFTGKKQPMNENVSTELSSLLDHIKRYDTMSAAATQTPIHMCTEEIPEALNINKNWLKKY